MTPLQTAKYFREWGLVREHYRKKGIDPKLCDAKRHELHVRALGVKKSSKLFTNADLDKVLAVFYAITRPADLNTQLRQQEQQIERMRKMQDDCRDLVRRLPKAAEVDDRDFYVKNYLNKVSYSHTGKAFAMLEEKELARILGILRDRLQEVAPF